MAMTHEWLRHLDTVRPLASLPHLTVVAVETVDDTMYRHAGIDRTDQHVCFQYSLSGTGRFRDPSGTYAVPAEHGFLCDVSDDHICYDYPPDAGEPWRFLYVTMRGAPALAMKEELVSRYGPLFQVPLQSAIMQRFLAFEQEAPQLAWPAFEAAALVFQLFRAFHESQGGDVANPHQHLVRRAMAIAFAERRRQLTVTALAARLQVSREHLSRTFQSELGITAHHYILRQRMRLACDLLKRTDLRIKEIAAELNYPDTAQFSRAFQNAIHMSPTTFRAEGIYPSF